VNQTEIRLRAWAAAHDGVVSAADVRRFGFTPDDIRVRLRRGEWRSLLDGVYLVDADLYADGVPLPTRARAALLAHPDGVLGLRTAARLLGIEGAGSGDTVELILPPERPRVQPGARRRSAAPRAPAGPAAPELELRLHWFAVAPGDVVSLHGLRVTAARRTVADILLSVDRLTGLAVVDSALYRGVLRTEGLGEVEALMAGRRGVIAAREILALADGRAESPLESRVRLRAIDGGVPPDDVQHPVVDRWGTTVGVGDLMWRRRSGRLLIAEADGAAPHSTPTAVFRDRHRGNDLTASQADTVRFTWADTLRAGYIPAVIRANLAA
jgi:hypothetical protein